MCKIEFYAIFTNSISIISIMPNCILFALDHKWVAWSDRNLSLLAIWLANLMLLVLHLNCWSLCAVQQYLVESFFNFFWWCCNFSNLIFFFITIEISFGWCCLPWLIIFEVRSFDSIKLSISYVGKNWDSHTTQSW